MKGIVLAAIALAGSPAHASPALKRPSFFIQPGNDVTLLKGIDRHTGDKIDFNRRFSLTFVPCGIGCGSFWFVDRRTGGVVEAPHTPLEAEDIWEVEARPESNVVRIIYGPREGGVGVRCAARHFRWSGKKFVPLNQRAVILCPQ